MTKIEIYQVDDTYQIHINKVVCGTTTSPEDAHQFCKGLAMAPYQAALLNQMFDKNHMRKPRKIK